jgi:hypothetical protein
MNSKPKQAKQEASKISQSPKAPIKYKYKVRFNIMGMGTTMHDAITSVMHNIIIYYNIL